ncbi:MAG: hypothetical protein ACXWKP_24400 [Bradyrhizobium sp.]
MNVRDTIFSSRPVQAEQAGTVITAFDSPYIVGFDDAAPEDHAADGRKMRKPCPDDGAWR